MTTESHTIICGICNRPITYRDPENQEGDVGCSECDNWDSGAEVRRIAGEYARDVAQIEMNKAAKRAADRSKMMSFKGDTNLTGEYRFKLEGFPESLSSDLN